MDRLQIGAVADDLARIAGARVLPVEDNDLNQEVASEILRQAGLVVDVGQIGAVRIHPRDPNTLWVAANEPDAPKASVPPLMFTFPVKVFAAFRMTVPAPVTVTPPLPLMMLSRLTRRTDAADYDPLAELRIGAVTNALLEGALDVERLLIRAGLSLQRTATTLRQANHFSFHPILEVAAVFAGIGDGYGQMLLALAASRRIPPSSREAA